ncbi:cyclodeaminase/cyclohydrolase family protein [Gallibacter intestinalis]|uniref:Cyclodeaminase/cyclohydrolase family protein n=1 Tax=Gallibacter intestinalis TaxID=2779356 RepID=A0ABR9QXE4_9FIRM|nr:cyclodeaminase/cyclohydrolase family protein [Gallibacter intestinalis]MBE5035541.1 cyclodeaminase/cyclohydrolase family protein [Gallibacter intestinalis]
MGKIADMSIKEYLDILKTDAPAPGGGGVSGLTAAQGISLTLMVIELTLGKKKYEEYMELIEKSRERALELYEELAVAADEDREVFLKLSEAYALPKETEEEKKIKQQVLGERSLAATEAPYKVMELSLEGLEITEKLVGKSNKMAVSDLGVAAACFLAACKSAWLNVKINLPYLTDKDRAQAFEKGGRNILEKVTALSEKIYDAVEKEI